MNFRSTLTKVITFLGGIYFFLEFVLPGEFLGVETARYHEDITNGFIVVGVMAIGLGIINILMIHGSKIAYRRSGWTNSVALLAGLVAMLVVTIMNWQSSDDMAKASNEIFILRDFSNRISEDAEKGRADVKPVWERNKLLSFEASQVLNRVDQRLKSLTLPLDAGEDDEALFAATLLESKHALEQAKTALLTLAVVDQEAKQAVDQNLSFAKMLGDVGSTLLGVLNITNRYTLGNRLYAFLYDGLFTALGSAMFSLLGFYIASAAYRAFRVRSGESALMMIAALIVMLGQIPFGLWIYSELPELRSWLLTIPSAAAFRAIKIGAGIAALAMAYRMWFSIESEGFESKHAD